MRTSISIGVLLAVSVALAACSSSSASPSAAPSAAPSVEASASGGGGTGGGSEAAVTIQNFAFAPADLSVKVGTKVTWTNQDSAGHTVTFDTGSDTSDTLGNGASNSQTFNTAGTFAYHCKIHPSMKASVTVTQ